MDLLLFIKKVIEHKQTLVLQADGHRENKCLGGSRIGIVAKPSAEFVAGVLGTWFSGGVAVPLALSYPEAELLHVMNDSVCSLNPVSHHTLLQLAQVYLNCLFIFQ